MNRLSSIIVTTIVSFGSAASAQTTGNKSAVSSGPVRSEQVSEQSIIANNDLNKDGVVTKAEATKADGGLIQNWADYDLNKDGKVDFTEATTGIAARRGAQISAQSIMTNNDLNKDGVVTKAEATKVDGGLIQNWADYDLNKDGKVDIGEATKGLAARQEASAGP